MVHVLFLPSWYPNGAQDVGGSFFREQALALAEQGAKVGVIAASLVSHRSMNMRPTGHARITRQSDHGVNTLRVSRYHLTPRMSRLTSLRHASLAQSLYSAYVAEFGKPDIVHLHAARHAGLAAQRLSEREQIPYVYSEHSSSFARGAVGVAGRRLVRDCALGASAAFAVSSQFARLLDRQLNLPSGFFDVMPNSVSSNFLSTPIRGLSTDLTRFVHISHLDDNKNVDGLLRSFAEAFLGDESVRLTIGGHGTNLRSLKRLSRELGLAAQVEFTGPLPREAVPDLLANSDVFVLPSRVETFGVVAIEALAMGLPVIATRCGGPEDVVGPCDGWLVPVGDVSALTDALVSAATPDDLPTRLARRERCRSRFASDVLASQWLEIYSRYAN